MRFNLAAAFLLSISLIGSVLVASPVDAALLYAAGSSNSNTPIYTIDTATGVQTTLGNSGVPNVQSLAFAPNGVLYGTTFSSGGGNMNLVTIDQTTGAATVVEAITPAFGTNTLNAATGLAFTSAGAAYLVGR